MYLLWGRAWYSMGGILMEDKSYAYRHEEYGQKMIILIDAKGEKEANIYLMATVQDPSKWELEGVF